MLAIIAYLLTAIAVGIFSFRAYTLFKKIKSGQPDSSRFNDKKIRFKNMLREVFTHTKMLNFTVTGIAHWFVMIGFFALLGTLITAYGQLLDPAWNLPVIGHFVGYELFAESIAALTGVGIVALIGIRQATRVFKKGRASRFYGSGNWKSYYVEVTILVIVFCVIALRGLEGALLGVDNWSWHFAISYPAVLFFSTYSIGDIENLIQIIAFIKIATSMIWFIVVGLNLNMGVAWHRFLAFFNIYFKKYPGKQNALGALPPTDFPASAGA